MKLDLPYAENVRATAYVGSRVTCNPPPADTDDDRLVLVRGLEAAAQSLVATGWERGGSNDPEAPLDEPFASFRKEGSDLNLIVTDDETFYRRFLAATEVCQRLNLMDKEDRIAVFRAVRLGHQHRVPELETEWEF